MENVTQMHMEMLSLLNQYEKRIYFDWCDGLEQACLINLSQPLISRNSSSGLISVNFNPKVLDTVSKNHFILCTVCKNMFIIVSSGFNLIS